MTMKLRRLTSFVLMATTLAASSSLTAQITPSSQVDALLHAPSENSVVVERFQSASPKHTRSKHSLHFNDTKATFTHRLHESDTSASAVDIGIRNVHFGYKGISSKDHLYATLGIRGGLITDDGWIWKGLARVEVPTKGWGLTCNSRYSAAMEGAYELNMDWTLFLGIGAETGMRATNVQPIIGAQYTWEDWVFHAVYPSPKVIYKGIEDCELSLNVESLFTAIRAHKVQQHKKGVAVFKGAGAEFRADYSFSDKLNGWLSLGRVFNGSVSVGDRHNHHSKKHSLSGPAYAQIGFSYAI